MFIRSDGMMGGSGISERGIMRGCGNGPEMGSWAMGLGMLAVVALIFGAGRAMGYRLAVRA